MIKTIKYIPKMIDFFKVLNIRPGGLVGGWSLAALGKCNALVMFRRFAE